MSKETTTAGIKVAKGQKWDWRRHDGAMGCAEAEILYVGMIEGEYVLDDPVMGIIVASRDELKTLHAHQCGHVLEEGFEYMEDDGAVDVSVWEHIHHSFLYRRLKAQAAINTKQGAIMSNETTTAGNRYEYLEADRFGILPQHGWEQVPSIDPSRHLYRRPLAQASEQGAQAVCECQATNLFGDTCDCAEPTPAEKMYKKDGFMYTNSDLNLAGVFGRFGWELVNSSLFRRPLSEHEKAEPTPAEAHGLAILDEFDLKVGGLYVDKTETIKSGIIEIGSETEWIDHAADGTVNRLPLDDCAITSAQWRENYIKVRRDSEEAVRILGPVDDDPFGKALLEVEVMEAIAHLAARVAKLEAVEVGR